MCNAYIEKQIAAEGLDQPEAIMLFAEWDGTKAKLLTDEALKPYQAAYRDETAHLIGLPLRRLSLPRPRDDPKRDGALFLVWKSDRYGNGLARVLDFPGRCIDWRHLAQ